MLKMVKNKVKHTIERTHSICSNVKGAIAGLVLVGGIGMVAVTPSLLADFFLCEVLTNASGSSGSFDATTIFQLLIFGAPIIGLVGGVINYAGNVSDGGAEPSQVYYPAAVGMAVPILAFLINGFIQAVGGSDISCLWS
jgi:hypothetical protein